MCSRLPLTPVLIMCSPGVHQARASPSTESQATIRSHLVIGNVCLCAPGTLGPRGRNCMAKRPRSPPGDPMTLGNMRANGVRSLDVSCWTCHHEAVLDAPRWDEPIEPMTLSVERIVVWDGRLVGVEMP